MFLCDPVPWPKSEPNYIEIEKVVSVTEVLGFRLVVHTDIPTGEVHFVQHGKLVGKIVNVKEA